MNKRVRCAVALLLLLLLFAACGRSETAEPTQTGAVSPAQMDADALLGQADVQHYDCAVRGHVFSVATCQKPASCYYCGETQGQKGPHDFTHATCLKKSACTVCGLERGETAAHIFSTASCAGPAACAVCGVTSGSAGSHSFRPATCVSPSRCSVCMRTTGAALGHIWTGGSCTSPQVCTRCKRQIAAPGHRMTAGSCTQDAVCTVCGYREKAPGHRFDNGVCTVCGLSRVEASREEASRIAQSEALTETTLPLDKTALAEYGASLETLLQTAHDLADDSIGEGAEKRVEMLDEAIETLKTALEQLDEAEALCEEDARSKTLKTQLEAVRKEIKRGASLSTNGDFIDAATSVRGDSTRGLAALRKYRTAVEAL